MAISYMERSRNSLNDGGTWWETQIIQASGLVSNSYILPVAPIYAIGTQITGSGTLAFTLDSIASITNGTAVYADWDGYASINFAVTGFKFTTTTASGVAKVIVKTALA